MERAQNMDFDPNSLEATQFRSNDNRTRDPWLRHLIETLVFHELLERRRHKRRRRDRHDRRDHRRSRY